MTSVNFVNRIKRYSVISFILPLIAINSCLLIFKYIGSVAHGPINIQMYADLEWEKTEHSYKFSEYNRITTNLEKRSYTNCPKYEYSQYYHTVEDKTLLAVSKNKKIIQNLTKENKIKSVSFKTGDSLNYQCIKNYSDKFLLIKKYDWIEKILKRAININTTGFTYIKNPYIYGEVSISRTARYFPSVIIFKSLVLLSALILFFYWKNNLNFFNDLSGNKIIDKFSRKFFYFGLLSCIFLTLHASFLGLDFDSEIFKKIRRLIIILFILFEILAQIFLTIHFFKFREQLKSYINLIILKSKIVFVFIVSLSTVVAFAVLAFGDPSTAFKHILEWNYFTFLLLYYFLSRLIWK